MTKIAFLFPGQGAQAVGMAKDVVSQVPVAKELFDRARTILGYDLLDVCVNGPKERLDATAISQPALYVAGLAAVEQLKQVEPAKVAAACCCAGLSLGEFTALTFAGALDFQAGLKLVQVRGESMQAAATATPSGMVAVIGADAAAVTDLCHATTSEPAVGLIQPANFLCPGNIVVSGTLTACDRLEQLASDRGLRTVRLAVAGAFHTSIMAPARERFAHALNQTEFQTPRIPVYSNVTAQPHTDPAAIRDLLLRQILEPVQWEATQRALLDAKVEEFYELGPGRVLAGLMKRVQRNATFVNITV